MDKFLKVSQVVSLLLIAGMLYLVSVRLHQIDQDVDNCSDFLQILSGK